MTRREFAQLLAAFGVASALPACAVDEGLHWDIDVRFTGKVVIVGAGAAGLAAGYLLDRYGIDFEILEAAPVLGGRTRRNDTLADFPIDIGAEWIHQDPSILSDLVDDPDATAQIDVVRYAPETVSVVDGQDVIPLNAGANFYAEWKFGRTTWWGFLDAQFAEPIRDRLHLGRPVERIEYGDRVRVIDTDGVVVECDRVLITAPIKVLQHEIIAFEPALPAAKADAIAAVHIPHGLKVFLRFAERFYPDIALVGLDAEKIWYDAAIGKESDDNVLALFWVSDAAAGFTDLDDDAIVARCLDELDALFPDRSELLDAVVQNWSSEPYIRGAYSYTYTGDETAIIDALNEPVDDVVWFAGEALSHDNTATVPGAMESAYATVRALLETPG